MKSKLSVQITLTLLLVVLFSTDRGEALRCYECDGFDFLCTVGLLGEKKECHPDTKNCYKSWTVETSPKTKRKCGSRNVVELGCKDVLFGPNSMLACYCDEHDYCNHAPSKSLPQKFAIFTPIIFFQLKSYLTGLPFGN